MLSVVLTVTIKFIMLSVVAGNLRQGAPLEGRLLASSTNIRLGWKGLPETNALAY